MKKKDLYDFQRGLESATFEHPRLTYAVNKNKRMVKQVIEDMELSIKPDEDVEKFTKEREELAKEYSTKDEKGNPTLKKVMVAPNKYQTIYVIEGAENKESPYRKELAKLELKYKDATDKHEVKINQYNEEFLNDDSDFEPFMVDIELLEAHEKCPQVVMDSIYYMIKGL